MEGAPPILDVSGRHGRVRCMCCHYEKAGGGSFHSDEDAPRLGLEDCDVLWFESEASETAPNPDGASSLPSTGGRMISENLLTSDLLILPVSRLLEAENVQVEINKLLLEELSPVFKVWQLYVARRMVALPETACAAGGPGHRKCLGSGLSVAS